MNKNVRGLIDAVVSNNNSSAKSYCKVLLASNRSEADKAWVEKTKEKLENPYHDFMNLPVDIVGKLIIENPAENFHMDRYYLSEREAQLTKQIIDLDKAAKKLSEIDVRYLNSVLLYGLSGTGKTTYGRYIAAKLKIPFIYVNFSMLIDSYLGATSSNIAKIFDFIADKRCVLLLDELDAIGMRREGGHGGSSGEMNRIVISLMQAIDSLNSNIVLIGATNRMDMIDDALKRRFFLLHEVKYFNLEERKAYIRKFVNSVNFKCNEEWIEELASPLLSQADIYDKLILALVDYYISQEE